MSRERELLERALEYWDDEDSYITDNIIEDIRAYLASEKQDHSDTLEKIELPSSMVYPEAKVQQVAAILPNGVRVTNVHDAYIAGMFEGSGLAKLKAEQDEEPVCWICTADDVASPCIEWKKDELSYWLRRKYEVKPLYLHPAPRKPFVRLEVQKIIDLVNEIVVRHNLAYELIAFARAIEDALEEKNK